MRPGQQNKRMRGRGRKGPNPMSRSYESNGPDVKIRGNAQHVAEKYIALARDASASGDRVMAENYLQHAEHYGRIVAAAQGTFQLQREETDFEGDYEDDGEEAVAETNGGAPNGHPYPVPERAGGGERSQQQPNQMRDNRDLGGNRDHQNNRDYGNNREYQGNREGREQRFNRDDRNRDNRDFQGRNNQNRDFNRNNQNRDNQNRGGDERRPWENRGERQGWQDRGGEQQMPNGLGPQPVVGGMDASGERPQPAARYEERAGEPRRDERVTRNEPVATPEGGFGEGVATAPEALAGPEGSIVPTEADRPSGEARRRGRPRRLRYGEGDGMNAGEVAAGSQEPLAPQAAPEPSAPAAPVEASRPAETAPTTEAASDAPAKRPRGRPRKKKPEDEAGEAPQLPDFLLASNG